MSLHDEIRFANLLILINEAGSQVALANRCDTSEAYISQLYNKLPDSKTGKPKAVGNRLARKLEAGMQKPVNWMDVDHTDTAQRMTAAEPRPIYAVTPPPSIRSTIAALGDALDLCTEDNRKAVAGLLAQYAVSPKPGGVADAIVMLLERCAVPTADNPYPNATPANASKRSGAKP